MSNDPGACHAAVVVARACRLAKRPLTAHALQGALLALGCHVPPGFLADLVALASIGQDPGVPGSGRPLPTAPVSRAGAGSSEHGDEAAYVYGIVAADEGGSLGVKGIEDSSVFTVAAEGLAAIVHRCPATPYSSDEPTRVKSWLNAQLAVLDAAMARYGAVVPTAFDTLVRVGPDEDLAAAVVKYLSEAAPIVTPLLERLQGRQEYGVGARYPVPIPVAEATGAGYLRARQEEMRARQRDLERVSEVRSQIHDYVKELGGELRPGGGRKDTEGSLAFHDALLLDKAQADLLGQHLDELAATSGLDLVFSGPWPPMSFIQPLTEDE